MKLSILHISDLHRDPKNPISNQVLLSSLERDRDEYTLRGEPNISAPNLLIVSGDIVQGVKSNDVDAETTLREQYDEALSLLNDLTKKFVEGDKQRVILVPGNHDVSDYHFRKSLTPIDVTDNNRKTLSAELLGGNSNLRWSWADFSLYRIGNQDMYHKRFAAFVDFYDRFYEGQRDYSLEPRNQFDVFYLSDLGITIAGFCSCFNNDLLNRQGDINPDCIVSAASQINRSLESQECIRIAVWHHNTEGLPAEINYMNPDIVQNLINLGFSLGFHGHQHKPEFIDKRFRYDSNRHINVISAGTLCGDAAFSHKRSYNIVELEIPEGKGRLHVRGMSNDNLSMPIWGVYAIPPSQVKYLDFTFESPPQALFKADHNTISLGKALKLRKLGKYRAAADTLSALPDDLARPLLLDCLIKLDDKAKIAMLFDPPKNPPEVIALLDALWEQGKKVRISEVLKLPIIATSTDPSIIEMSQKYTRRLRNEIFE